MSGNLNFEARVLLHAWNAGIVHRADVSAWADQCLAADTFEPSELSGLASLSVPEQPVSDEVRRELERLAAPDSSTAHKALVGIVARLYEVDALTLRQVARILYHLQMEPFGNEYPGEFWGFWDELDLAEQGIIPQQPEEVQRRLESILKNFREYAEWFQPGR